MLSGDTLSRSPAGFQAINSNRSLATSKGDHLYLLPLSQKAQQGNPTRPQAFLALDSPLSPVGQGHPQIQNPSLSSPATNNVDLFWGSRH
jgi:hypothetical protein